MTKYGRPITTNSYVSMDHGPVLSNTLNLINGSYRETHNSWESNIESVDNHDVKLIRSEDAI